MIVVKEHASTVRNRTGKVRFARAMPTTNPRTGMLCERDCKTRFKTSLENKQRQKVLSTKLSTRNVFTNIYGFIAKE